MPAPADERPSRAPAAGPVSTAFDSDFDPLLHRDRLDGLAPGPMLRTLIGQVLQGLHDPTTPTLTASWGERAVMRMDFGSRLVMLDPLALQGLRVRREPPSRMEAADLGDLAVAHELDEVVWHLGIACGRHVLLDQCADWWHRPLLCTDAVQIEHYARQPRHLSLARRLAQGPATPAALRTELRVPLDSLRGFIQACLFLGLVRWAGSPATRGPAGLVPVAPRSGAAR